MRHRPIGNLPLLFAGLRELFVSYLIQIAALIGRQMCPTTKTSVTVPKILSTCLLYLF